MSPKEQICVWLAGFRIREESSVMAFAGADQEDLRRSQALVFGIILESGHGELDALADLGEFFIATHVELLFG